MRIFKLTLCALLFFAFYARAFADIPIEERQAVRQQLNQAAEEMIAAMIEKNAVISEVLEDSAGYLESQITVSCSTGAR